MREQQCAVLPTHYFRRKRCARAVWRGSKQEKLHRFALACHRQNWKHSTVRCSQYLLFIMQLPSMSFAAAMRISKFQRLLRCHEYALTSPEGTDKYMHGRLNFLCERPWVPVWAKNPIQSKNANKCVKTVCYCCCDNWYYVMNLVLWLLFP